MPRARSSSTRRLARSNCFSVLGWEPVSGSDCVSIFTYFKNLSFTEIAKRKACIFVGKHSPFYNRDKITPDELKEISFIMGMSDFFSIEHNFEEVNLGPYSKERLKSSVYTNSEHLTTDMLMETDLVVMGIDVVHSNYIHAETKTLPIEGEDSNLILGYVKGNKTELSDTEIKVINMLKDVLEEKP